MRFSQLILGFERNKQGEGDEKNLSQIRVMKDRYFGQTGVVGTKYDIQTGRLTQRPDHEYNPKTPFKLTNAEDEADTDTGEVVRRNTETPF